MWRETVEVGINKLLYLSNMTLFTLVEIIKKKVSKNETDDGNFRAAAPHKKR